ncbi:MAG: SGNH/GDSL hydrolase family protein [Candidatus Faecousia sp.]|nr:SGNH/GDSL hydrolase family protein [Candidatus Faecousia sp.]
MKTILFQGDSITDAGRDRENCQDLGKGYPNLVAGRLGLDTPGQYRFLNRGVSGDRIVDIYARMKRDILNLKPDFMSILVGVNDAWHELDFGNGVSTEKFQRIYRMLLTEIREALPETRILLLEPYVMPGCATEKYLERFTAEVADRAEAVRLLAKEFDLPFIPLQKPLEELTRQAPAEYWLVDGVHPNVPFHQYIADRWLEVFRETEL